MTATAVNERPFVLTDEEVRESLASREAVISRPIKELPPRGRAQHTDPGCLGIFDDDGRGLGSFWFLDAGRKPMARLDVYEVPGNPWQYPLPAGERHPKVFQIDCPFGKPGDRLWVREAFVELLAVSPATDEPVPIGPGERLLEPPTKRADGAWNFDGKVIAYRANSAVEFCDGDGFSGEMANREDMPRWKAARQMPREYSRLTLEVAGVRVERAEDGPWQWVAGVRRLDD